MHWKFDIDQRSLVKAVDGSSVKSAKIAYPDKYPIRVDFYNGATPFVLTGALKATLKPINQQINEPLAFTEVPVTSSSSALLIVNLGTDNMEKFVKKFGERPLVLELLVSDISGVEVSSWPVTCDISNRYATFT